MWRLKMYKTYVSKIIANLLILVVIILMVTQTWSRGSSGSIVSDYGLDDRGSIPDRGR
jgi:hypothetical protein